VSAVIQLYLQIKKKSLNITQQLKRTKITAKIILHNFNYNFITESLTKLTKRQLKSFAVSKITLVQVAGARQNVDASGGHRLANDGRTDVDDDDGTAERHLSVDERQRSGGAAAHRVAVAAAAVRDDGDVRAGATAEARGVQEAHDVRSARGRRGRTQVQRRLDGASVVAVALKRRRHSTIKPRQRQRLVRRRAVRMLVDRCGQVQHQSGERSQRYVGEGRTWTRC